MTEVLILHDFLLLLLLHLFDVLNLSSLTLSKYYSIISDTLSLSLLPGLFLSFVSSRLLVDGLSFFTGTLASLSIIWLFENKNPNQPCIQLVLVTSQSWLSNLVTDQSHHFIGLLPSVNPRLMVLWALMISVAPS